MNDYKSMQKRLEAQGATTAETLLEVIKAKDRFIQALQGVIEQREAEIAKMRETLTAVRHSLTCTKQAPFEYDANHHCSVCGSGMVYAKDLIDAQLGERP